MSKHKHANFGKSMRTVPFPKTVTPQTIKIFLTVFVTFGHLWMVAFFKHVLAISKNPTGTIASPGLLNYKSLITGLFYRIVNLQWPMLFYFMLCYFFVFTYVWICGIKWHIFQWKWVPCILVNTGILNTGLFYWNTTLATGCIVHEWDIWVGVIQ